MSVCLLGLGLVFLSTSSCATATTAVRGRQRLGNGTAPRQHMACPLQCGEGASCGVGPSPIDPDAAAEDYLEWLLTVSSPDSTTRRGGGTPKSQASNPPLPTQALTDGLATCSTGNETLRAIHGVDITAAAYAQISFSSPFVVQVNSEGHLGEQAKQQRTLMSEFYLQEYVHMTPPPKGSIGGTGKHLDEWMIRGGETSENNQQPLRAYGSEWDYNGRHFDSYVQGYLFDNWANRTSYEWLGEQVVYPIGVPTLRATAMAGLALVQSWNLELAIADHHHQQAQQHAISSSDEGENVARKKFTQRMNAMQTTTSPAILFATQLYTTTIPAMNSEYLYFESPMPSTGSGTFVHAGAPGMTEGEERSRRVASPREGGPPPASHKDKHLLGKALNELLEEAGARNVGASATPSPFNPFGPTVGPPPIPTTASPPTPVPSTATPHTHSPPTPSPVTGAPPTPAPTPKPYQGVVVSSSQFITYALTKSLVELYAKVPDAGYTAEFVKALTSANETLAFGVFFLAEFMSVEGEKFQLTATARFGSRAGTPLTVHYFPVAVSIAEFGTISGGVKNPALQPDQCDPLAEGGPHGQMDPCSPQAFDVETQLLAIATYGWDLNLYASPVAPHYDGESATPFVLDLLQVTLAAGSVLGSSAHGAALGRGIGRNFTSPYLINLAVTVTEHLIQTIPPVSGKEYPRWNNSTQRHDAVIATLQAMQAALSAEESLQNRQCRLTNGSSSTGSGSGEELQHRALFGTMGENACLESPFPLTQDTAMAVLAAGKQNPFRLFDFTFPTAPPTPAPSTAIPPTPVPTTTPVPSTPVPPTPVPNTTTAVPPTPAPTTAEPPTPVPATGTPPTPVPETPNPATPTPPTPHPASPSPPSPAPMPPSPSPPTPAPSSPTPTRTPQPTSHKKRTHPPQTQGPKAPGPAHHSGATTAIIAISVVGFCGLVAGSLIAYRQYKKSKEADLLRAPTENLGFY